MRTRGIKGSLLKRTRTAKVPSKSGSCKACEKQGQVRYFVAAKLPRFMYLCDEHYLKIRNLLEKALGEILREEGLL